MRRRVGRDLVIIDGDSVDPHAGEFGLAGCTGGGLRQFAEQGRQCGLGISRIGVDRHRSHRLDLADKARLLRLLVELIRRVAARIDDDNHELADLALVDRAQHLGIVIGSDQRRAQ